MNWVHPGIQWKAIAKKQSEHREGNESNQERHTDIYSSLWQIQSDWIMMGYKKYSFSEDVKRLILKRGQCCLVIEKVCLFFLICLSLILYVLKNNLYQISSVNFLSV